MEEQTFALWVELPDARPVRFDDLTTLIAGALHEDGFAQAAAEINLEAELRAMVAAGELMVRNALTLGPHTSPIGQALRDSVLLPEDLRPLLAKRGMGLRFKAGSADPLPGVLNERHHKGGAVPDLHNVPTDWGAYRIREDFTLFEVACLVHRLEPRAVFDDAHHAIRRRGGAAAEVLRSPAAAAELLHLNPAAFFIAPVGDALERLKRAAGSRLGLTVNAERARALAVMLGVPYPPELECEALAASPTPEPAPAVVAVDGPLPLTTGDIAFCFDGLRYTEARWKKPLGDKPKWLSACVAIPGRRGVSETRWNPVLIGAALVRAGHVSARSVRARFQSRPMLIPWLDVWKTYEADHIESA